jgi:hypothetical protein
MTRQPIPEEAWSPNCNFVVRYEIDVRGRRPGPSRARAYGRGAARKKRPPPGAGAGSPNTC